MSYFKTKKMYYTHCAEPSVISITMLQPTYVTKTFLYYTYDHCHGECFESLLFFHLVQKKRYVLKYEKQINRPTQNDFFF